MSGEALTATALFVVVALLFAAVFVAGLLQADEPLEDDDDRGV